jgi:RimJ/RimL family protein N-acetyltransferase
VSSPPQTVPRWQGLAFEVALEAALHTPRLRLEPIAERHADGLWAPLADPLLYSHVPQEPPASPQALRERCALLSTRRSPQGDQLWLNWVMCDARDGRYLGRLQATVHADGSAWIAYEVFSPFWHRGFASEGCAAMIAWLIQTLGVQQLVAEVDSLNEASLRLLDRLGFQRLSLRQAADHFKGRSSDEWTLRLAATDFLRNSACATPQQPGASRAGAE